MTAPGIKRTLRTGCGVGSGARSAFATHRNTGRRKVIISRFGRCRSAVPEGNALFASVSPDGTITKLNCVRNPMTGANVGCNGANMDWRARWAGVEYGAFVLPKRSWLPYSSATVAGSTGHVGNVRQDQDALGVLSMNKIAGLMIAALLFSTTAFAQGFKQ